MGFIKPFNKQGPYPKQWLKFLHPEFKERESCFKAGDIDFLPLFRQIISSDFDVDRMDYLQRDSLHCGVKYGLIDFIWLISHFDCHIQEDQAFLAINKGGLYTLESFILGRQHMRLIVYFHHKSVIYNKMLKKYAEESTWALPAHLPEYINWTDSQLKNYLRSQNAVWAKRIAHQKPYVRLAEYVFFTSSPKELETQNKLKKLKQKLKREYIPFIEINSEEDSLTSYKKHFAKSVVYLKSPESGSASPLYEDPSFLPLPPRKIQRIYIPPAPGAE